MASGIYVHNPSTPRPLIELLNAAVIDWHANLWGNIIGRELAAPEFSLKFCRRRRCPNAAYLYVDRMDCTRKREGLEVKLSTLPAERCSNSSALGLVATREFTAGTYICAFSWNMKPGLGGNQPIFFLVNSRSGSLYYRVSSPGKGGMARRCIKDVDWGKSGRRVGPLLQYCTMD